MPAALLFMGIAQKHAYRFGFLRSEFWRDFRLAALVHYGPFCFICGGDDASVDVHHLWYPRPATAVKIRDVRPLCRKCHDRAHRKTTPGKYRKLREAVVAFQAVVNKAMLAKRKKGLQLRQGWRRSRGSPAGVTARNLLPVKASKRGPK